MKITYLAPPPKAGERPAERVSGCARVIYNVPNIYALWIAAMLERDGHQVRYVDAALERWTPERFRAFLRNDDSDGFLLYSVNLSKGLDISSAKLIRELLGPVPVIFTGPSPSDKVEDFVLDAQTFVVRGEAEATTCALVRALCDRTPPEAIDGLSWRMADGPVRHSPPRALIDNLDEVPFPARHLLDREAYFNPKLGIRPFTAVMTSRGCPNRCTFCVPSSVTFAAELEHKRYFGCKPPVRLRSIDNIVAEFEQLAAEGYRAISIQDDQFAWGTERTVELCRRLAPLKLTWGCSCRADRLNEPILKAMAAAGCQYIDIGVESFDPQVLRAIKKGYDDPRMVEAVIKLVQKHGIKAKINILFGLSPLETKATIKRTTREVRRIGPDQVMYDIVSPFPGTELYDRARQEGWFRYGDYVPADVGRHSIIQLPHVKPSELERAVRYANLRFFLSPRFLLRNLLALRSLSALKHSAIAMYPQTGGLMGATGISVIVPVYNEERNIAGLTGSLDRLVMDADDEVILVDDGSTDRSLELLQDYVRSKARAFHLVHLPENRGRAEALNAGLREAEGALLAFTDADAQPPEDWLDHVRGWFDDPTVVAAGGAFAPSNPGEGLVAWYHLGDRVMNDLLGKGLTANKLSGVNAAVRRPALLQVGGFRREAWWSEDSDLCFRLKGLGRIHYDPGVIVTTAYPATLAEIWRRKWIWGQAMGLTFRREGIPDPRLLLRPVLLVALAGTLALLPFLRGPQRFLLLLGFIALHLGVAALLWGRSARKWPFRDCLAVLPLLVMREAAYVGGLLDGLLRGDAVRNRASWRATVAPKRQRPGNPRE